VCDDLAGEKATGQLLILSQVVLTCNCRSPWCRCDVHGKPRQDGPFVAPRWLTALAVATAALIIALI